MLQPGELNHLFIETHHQHFRRAHCRFNAFGLGEGQPKLLRQLAEEDGLSQVEIARRCNLEPATVTVTLARLEKAGLVTRCGDETDMRVMRIRLTEEGRRLNEMLGSVFLECEEECFRGFLPAEREQLAQYLNRMRENMLHAENAPRGREPV